MALDGIFIHSIILELKKLLVDGRVEKVNQPEKDEIFLTIKNNRTSYKLSLSASSSYPRINIVNESKANPSSPPMFCMVLRKYLNSAKILDIRQLSTDRVIFIDFESSDELGFDSVYRLVVEIMGRHSNISLIRQRDQVVMDSIKHLTPDMNSVRTLLPGIKFCLPPASEKLNPLDFNSLDFVQYIHNQELEFDNTMFSKIFTGISSQFSKDLFFRLKKDNLEIKEEYLDLIYSKLIYYFTPIKNNQFKFLLYMKNNIIKDFYCVQLLSTDYDEMVEFSSASSLLEGFYQKKDKQDRLNIKSSNLTKLVSTNIDRCSKKLKLLNATLEECKDKDKFRIYGELLTAYIHILKPNLEEIKLLNYYLDEETYVNIKLDKQKTPSQNIQHYFKKYNKYKKAEIAATLQIKSAKEELEYLNSVITNIRNSEDYIAIEEIKKELTDTKYIKFKKTDNKKPKPSKPLHFISSDGIHIYVGKNNIQNDYLTLKLADKHDLWMHTKEIPGSHVIVKNFGEVPDKTLQEAALLAGFYSKAKDSSKVPVDYTEVKNVHKPSGAKPGMVIYYTNKTIYVTPYKPEIEEITK